MARTSSGGVSNSAAKKFSNVGGRITNDNYNRLVGSATIYEQLKNINDLKSLPINRYPNFQPLTTIQIVANANLKCNYSH